MTKDEILKRGLKLMNYKLIASICMPFAMFGLLMAVSEAQQPPSRVIIRSGDGALIGPPGPELKANPRRKVVDRAWEQYLDESTGEVYFRELTRYSNGDVEHVVGPEIPEFIPPEFQPQFAPTGPAPYSTVSPSCANAMQSSSLAGSAVTGQIQFNAAVLCTRIGPGSTPCNTFVAKFNLDQLMSDGQWHPVGYNENRYSSGCGATAHPWFGAQCGTKGGYYRARCRGYDDVNNANLWDQSIQFEYTG